MSLKAYPSGFSLPGFQGILSSAALFQKDFSSDWIIELSGNKTSLVLFALEEGIRHSWLARSGPGMFYFSDLKKREELQNELTAKEKEQLHQRMAHILMKNLPEEGDHKTKMVAYHLLQVSATDEGECFWLARAGEAYLRNFRIHEALQCYSKALEHLGAQSIDKYGFLFSRAAILYSKISTGLHDAKKVNSILHKAYLHARRLNHQPSLALLNMHLAKNEWLRSRYSQAIKYFQNGWSIATDLNDPKILISVTTFKNLIHFWQGYFQEAIRSYEKSIPHVEKYPQSPSSLYAALSIAYCYVQTGHLTQGLGMMDAIRKFCLERGDRYTAAHAQLFMGATMIDIGRVDDALRYLNCSYEEASQENNGWTLLLGKLMLAYAHYLHGENGRSLIYLSEFLEQTSRVHITVRPFPYLIKLCWAMEQGKIPQSFHLSFLKELRHMLNSGNIFIKGVAYRYQALYQRSENLPDQRIIHSLKSSVKLLKQSGSQIQIAKSQIEFARQYLLLNDLEKAKEMSLQAFKILSSYDEKLFPGDLRNLIQEAPNEENLLKNILRLGQEVVSIRDNQELVQKIISMGNRITGAERGAIFLWDEGADPQKFHLRASKNLTLDEINHQSFESSMKMVEEVLLTKRGRIMGVNWGAKRNSFPNEIIRSRICVPMILREKVVGVIYHDNRLLSTAFKESDLELLAFFAAQAAIALDNAKAYKEIENFNEKLKEEKLYYEKQHLQNLHFEDIVGESSAIMHVLAQVDEVANTDATVLILGETGVGKELVAKAIHRHSSRRDRPFIRVFCSALPESLIPSELFGHEKGAFTGAVNRRLGRFELADGGTLFLDEIGDLPHEIQVRLLRVLQSKEFERVGGSETIHSDFRLLAATNRDLEQAVKQGRFRMDLFYRLNVFPIFVPPLRERKEDIPLLAHNFLKTYATKVGKSFEGIPELEMGKLMQYEWPGNVRELENIIERAVILNSGPFLRVPELTGTANSDTVFSRNLHTLKDNERRHILWALQKTGWKVRGLGGAAELLEIHPSTLAFRMKKLGIDRPADLPRKRRGSNPKLGPDVISFPAIR